MDDFDAKTNHIYFVFYMQMIFWQKIPNPVIVCQWIDDWLEISQFREKMYHTILRKNRHRLLQKDVQFFYTPNPFFYFHATQEGDLRVTI